ncbi:MAG: sugar transferase [Pseudomonadota bacterium]
MSLVLIRTVGFYTTLERSNATRLGWRRLLDLAFAMLCLPCLLFLGLCLLILNPIWNPGALIYRQQRIGLRGATFVLFKFRTMQGQTSRPKFASQEKARIGCFADFLRRHRLDELPQIINVLKGEMTVIGPRPEQPFFEQRYANCLSIYAQRRRERPGLTSLGQVRVGYADDVSSMRRKLAFDRLYRRQRNPWLSLYVLWRTVCVMWTGAGGR